MRLLSILILQLADMAWEPGRLSCAATRSPSRQVHHSHLQGQSGKAETSSRLPNGRDGLRMTFRQKAPHLRGPGSLYARTVVT